MAKRVTASALIPHLLPEAFQTETSAAVHCSREADRLGATAPGRAMREIAAHARRTLPELERLATARGQRAARKGSVIGRMFSNVRSYGTDLLLSVEKSYRGTLHGVHHAIGTFSFLEDVAIAIGDQELADFCASWLSERKRLMEEAESDIAWFADHPAIALSRTKPPVVAKLRPIRATVQPST